MAVWIKYNPLYLLCHLNNVKIYLQVKLLAPHRVQLLRHGARSFFNLAHLHGDVRVGGAALVLSDQSLCANDCGRSVAFSTRSMGQRLVFQKLCARLDAFAKNTELFFTRGKKE